MTFMGISETNIDFHFKEVHNTHIGIDKVILVLNMELSIAVLLKM